MIIIAVSGYKEQGKSLVSSLLPSHLNNKKCINISYYDVLDLLIPGVRKTEKQTYINIINNVSPNYFIEHIKIKIALWQNLYDVIILDDIDTESAMQLVKFELKAVLIGVVKDYPYELPYIVRNVLTAKIMGKPDFILKNNMTINGLQSSIKMMIEIFKGKELI